MAVYAITNDGERVKLHPGCGETAAEVLERLNPSEPIWSLNGSGMYQSVFSDVWLPTVDGSMRYDDIARLEDFDE